MLDDPSVVSGPPVSAEKRGWKRWRVPALVGGLVAAAGVVGFLLVR